ncbi:MAG TPA: hypothetical protein VJU78_10425 [Chitinophagaceae bacterium]|nr:hypothetical protein [Chitinophagaceae bacterium]
MNPQFLQRMLIRFPDWHRQPFRLSIEEMEDPYLVLDEFFSCYNLMNIRAYLREWLNEAMHSHESGTIDLLSIYEYVEKLIEAAWLLYSKEMKGGKWKID